MPDQVYLRQLDNSNGLRAALDGKAVTEGQDSQGHRELIVHCWDLQSSSDQQFTFRELRPNSGLFVDTDSPNQGGQWAMQLNPDGTLTSGLANRYGTGLGAGSAHHVFSLG